MVFPWILRIIIPVEPILFFHIVGFGPKIILPKLGKQYASDRRLTKELEKLGVSFLRFEDIEVKRNMANVLRVIEGWIKKNEPTPSR